MGIKPHLSPTYPRAEAGSGVGAGAVPGAESGFTLNGALRLSFYF